MSSDKRMICIGKYGKNSRDSDSFISTCRNQIYRSSVWGVIIVNLKRPAVFAFILYTIVNSYSWIGYLSHLCDKNILIESFYFASLCASRPEIVLISTKGFDFHNSTNAYFLRNY